MSTAAGFVVVCGGSAVVLSGFTGNLIFVVYPPFMNAVQYGGLNEKTGVVNSNKPYELKIQTQFLATVDGLLLVFV
jgi:hypothetical protein